MTTLYNPDQVVEILGIGDRPDPRKHLRDRKNRHKDELTEGVDFIKNGNATEWTVEGILKLAQWEDTSKAKALLASDGASLRGAALTAQSESDTAIAGNAATALSNGASQEAQIDAVLERFCQVAGAMAAGKLSGDLLADRVQGHALESVKRPQTAEELQQLMEQVGKILAQRWGWAPEVMSGMLQQAMEVATKDQGSATAEATVEVEAA